MSIKVALGAALAGIVLAAGPAHARQAARQASRAPFELTVANIMRGPELVGEAPSAVRWSDDGRWVFFRWKPGGLPWDTPSSLYRVRAEGGAPEKLSDAAADSLAPLIAEGDVSSDGRRRVVSSRGDLFLIDRQTLDVRRLTETRTAETSPIFSKDGAAVYFIRDDNVFELTLAQGSLRQVTDVRTGPAPSEEKLPAGQRGFLVEQQRQLFEHIRRLEEEDSLEEARTERREAADPLKPLYLGKDERVFDLEIEPAGRHLVIAAGARDSDARRTVIPYWITESGYTETREGRTKVGDETSGPGRLGVVSVRDGSVVWLDLAHDAGADSAVADSTHVLGDTRFLGWNMQGTAGLIGVSSADFKDAWLWVMDAATGRLTQVASVHDDAWVDGPCPFWASRDCAGWLPDGETVYYTSERDGYNHLYTVRADGSGEHQLTRGPWEVQSVALSRARDHFELTTNEGSPHEVHFYHMAFDGGDRTRITTMPGRQDVMVSPDGKRLAMVHSFSNQPPELYLRDNRAGARDSRRAASGRLRYAAESKPRRTDDRARRITTSPTVEWSSFAWVAPEIIHIPARDGTAEPARIYTSIRNVSASTADRTAAS